MSRRLPSQKQFARVSRSPLLNCILDARAIQSEICQSTRHDIIRQSPAANRISHRSCWAKAQRDRLFLYLKKQSAAKLPVKILSLSLLVQQFLHLFESYSADVVRSPAARQQHGRQYY